jgi:hypothetical protein
MKFEVREAFADNANAIGADNSASAQDTEKKSLDVEDSSHRQLGPTWSKL